MGSQGFDKLNFGGLGLAALQRHHEMMQGVLMTPAVRYAAELSKVQRAINPFWLTKIQESQRRLAAVADPAIKQWQLAADTLKQQQEAYSYFLTSTVLALQEQLRRIDALLPTWQRSIIPHIWIPLQDLTGLFGPTWKWLQEDWPWLVCEMTRQAYDEGDSETIQVFFERYLDIPNPKAEHWMALKVVLDQPGWRKANNPLAWVKRALWREVNRYKRDEETADRRGGIVVPRDAEIDLQLVSMDATDADGKPLIELAAPWDGFASVEVDELVRWAVRKINPQDRKAFLLYLHGANWQEIGRLLYGNPNEGRVAGQRVKRQLQKMAPHILN